MLPTDLSIFDKVHTSYEEINISIETLHTSGVKPLNQPVGVTRRTVEGEA